MKNKKEKKERINKGSTVILEKPIGKLEEDVFNTTPYIEQLKEACQKDAIFIAVNGKFGSGKSSIIKLFQNQVEDKNNFFVHVNFMNINAISKDSEYKNKTKNNKNLGLKDIKTNDTNNTNDTSALETKYDDDKYIDRLIVNDYHRYFVNQVINDICKNPYQFEKLFYTQMISYSTLNINRNKIYKKVIDKILLFLISLIIVYTLFGYLFSDRQDIYGHTYNLTTEYFPLIILLTGILIFIYGYGFYKPNKDEVSPILNTDKCRNNFSKVIHDYLPSKSTLYLVIDDLDRVNNSGLQLEIISLLFNEYYPLNKQINEISLKFIFMIDINKIKNSDTLTPEKIFDYILSISSNQKNILKYYTEKIINENVNLKKLFNNKYREYLIGLIISNFKEIREIKHLLNRILTKHQYLFNQGITIESKQLIIMSILANITTDEDKLSSRIEEVLNKYSDTDSKDKIDSIIIEGIDLNIINKNYYIYIYNFIDKNNLISNYEQHIIDVMINTEHRHITKEQVSKINNNISYNEVRPNIIYNECYKYINNNKRIILLGNKKLYKYIYPKEKNYNELLLNSYQNKYIYDFYTNVKNNLNESDRMLIIQEIKIVCENFDSGDLDAREKLDEMFLKLVDNLENHILAFDIKDILSIHNINNELFNKLLNLKQNGNPILYELILQEKLSVDDILQHLTKDIVSNIRIKSKQTAFDIKSKIIDSKASNKIKLYLLISEKNKFNNVETIFKNFANDTNLLIELEELKLILNNYGYYESLDRFIIEILNNTVTRNDFIKELNKNKYDISLNTLNAINNLNNVYGFSTYYEEKFENAGLFKLLIFSNALNNKSFTLTRSLANNSNYINSIFTVYTIMGKGFKNYHYSQAFLKKIILQLRDKNYVLKSNDIWKIDILIPALKTYEDYCIIFEFITKSELINNFLNHCKTNPNSKYIKLLEIYKIYSTEMFSPSIKGKITKTLNKVKEKVGN